ncbi:hypothetical protein F0562_006976 [Nyssa sinensis]|uniref:Uncharacterized protein n=1 Tax=Nyssa sinensis TaxID=561372 RepID=A0A5J5A3Z7_9ASTE|nr:hypothetical protein F0562_006976 [Nyssa sinensis]
MEDSGKTPESDDTGDFAGVLREFLAISDDDCGDDFSPKVPIKEELVEKVMQELWKEINCCYSYTNPPSSPASFPASSSSVFVVGGDNENCGPSFSDSSLTVMAGIEMGGANAKGGGVSCFLGPTDDSAGGNMGFPSPAGDGSSVVEQGGCCDGGGGEIMGEKMDGCDGGDFDDEWLTRVLSCGPQELDKLPLRSFDNLTIVDDTFFMFEVILIHSSFVFRLY